MCRHLFWADERHSHVNISDCVQRKEKCLHLSNHTIPCPINLLAMFAVGDQVEVISELDRLGDLLKDVNTKTLAAALDVNPWITCLVAGKLNEEGGESRSKDGWTWEKVWDYCLFGLKAIKLVLQKTDDRKYKGFLSNQKLNKVIAD